MDIFQNAGCLTVRALSVPTIDENNTQNTIEKRTLDAQEPSIVESKKEIQSELEDKETM